MTKLEELLQKWNKAEKYFAREDITAEVKQSYEKQTIELCKQIGELWGENKNAH
ncbi:MAG: hypothetical protein RLZZ577_79 [Bacteroidota bacterium]|jgi:hypothetical protein